MRVHVFRGVGRTGIEHVPIPKPGPDEGLVHVTLMTICGTDLHLVRGEYPVKAGLVIGHEPVGVIAELGPRGSLVTRSVRPTTWPAGRK